MRHTTIYSIAMAAAVLMLSGCNHESADWKTATAANSMDSYQQFLKQHPTSSYASAANARIKELMTDQDWQTAASTDTRDAYEAFIAQHADSKWVQEAKIRIENFPQSGAPAASADSNPPGVAADAAVAGTATAATASTALAAPRAKAAATTSATRAPPRLDAASAAPGVSKAASKAVASAGTAANHHSQMVQLGAFSTRERAQSQWKELSAKFPTELKSLKPDYQPAKSKSGTVYRLRVPVVSAAAATGLCGTLKKHSQTCVVLAKT